MMAWCSVAAKVKSFNDEKGWGHISCDATNKIYQKDPAIPKMLNITLCVPDVAHNIITWYARV